jgi:hypothetical protein
MRADESSNVRHVKKQTLDTKTLWINFLSKMKANIVSMNHCGVCNTVVRSLNKHIETQKHRKLINNSIISNDYFNTKIKCVICNREVQNLKRHEKTNAHRKRLNDNILASSFFYCKLCNLEVDDIGAHGDSNVHFKNKFGCMHAR